MAMPAAVAIALTGSMAVIDILQRQNPPGPGIGYWIRYTLLLSLSGLPIVALRLHSAHPSSAGAGVGSSCWLLVPGSRPS